MKNINWILIDGLIGSGVLLTRLFKGTSGFRNKKTTLFR